MHVSTKTYGHEAGLTATFRQHRAHSHCRFLHGYALAFRLEFEADELDRNGWVVDFGSLKSFKAQLENTFDHRLLVAEDDPMLESLMELSVLGLAQVVVVEATGCEAFAKLVYDCAELWLKDAGYAPRVRMRSVTCSEHAGNSAIYFGGAT
jgi:6-pyruvoyltetrahydropterin/6-carboxytetrahydropterin synthase